VSPTFTVLIIGDATSAEMQPTLHALAARSSEITMRYAADVDAAAGLEGTESWHADLCVVCQHWPDEFAEADVARFLGLFPLARLMCAYGPWCASDGRSRDAWPLSARVPWHAAPARIEREFRVLCGELDPLPLTASRDEIYEFDQDHGREGEMIPLPEGRSAVALRVRDVEFSRLVADVLRRAGFPVVAVAESDQVVNPDAAALVWDVDPWRADTIQELAAFRMRSPQVRVIALAGMLSADDVSALKAAGASEVVWKLAPAIELVESIRAAAGNAVDVS
jgi:hypothetical protein